MRPPLLFAALLLVAGCGTPPKAVLVSGKLLQDGKAFAAPTQGLPPGDPGMRLGFISLAADGKAGERYHAQLVPSDGTFGVKGLAGKGIPPGKYRIAVEKGAFGSPDELKGAFGPENSPLVVELPDASSAKLVVDLSKKAVTLE